MSSVIACITSMPPLPHPNPPLLPLPDILKICIVFRIREQALILEGMELLTLENNPPLELENKSHCELKDKDRSKQRGQTASECDLSNKR